MKLERLLAISLPDNRPSINLLAKLGFNYRGLIRLADDDEDLSCDQLDLLGASSH